MIYVPISEVVNLYVISQTSFSRLVLSATNEFLIDDQLVLLRETLANANETQKHMEKKLEEIALRERELEEMRVKSDCHLTTTAPVPLAKVLEDADSDERKQYAGVIKGYEDAKKEFEDSVDAHFRKLEEILKITEDYREMVQENLRLAIETQVWCEREIGRAAWRRIFDVKLDALISYRAKLKLTS